MYSSHEENGNSRHVLFYSFHNCGHAEAVMASQKLESETIFQVNYSTCFTHAGSLINGSLVPCYALLIAMAYSDENEFMGE